MSKINKQLTDVLNAEEAYTAARKILEAQATGGSMQYMRIKVLQHAEEACQQQADALKAALDEESK